MSSAPIHHYTLLCDDVRREDNGKLIVIGLYLPDIVVPHVPIVLPQLVFLQLLEWASPGQYTLRASLDCLSEEGASNTAGGISLVPVAKAGTGVHAFRFGNITLHRTGQYVYRVFYNSQDDQVIEHKFKVLLPPIQKSIGVG